MLTELYVFIGAHIQVIHLYEMNVKQWNKIYFKKLEFEKQMYTWMYLNLCK